MGYRRLDDIFDGLEFLRGRIVLEEFLNDIVLIQRYLKEVGPELERCKNRIVSLEREMQGLKNNKPRRSDKVEEKTLTDKILSWFKIAFLFLFLQMVLLFILHSLAQPGHAARLHPEKEYQEAWCAAHDGVTEYVLNDQTRVDCLTDDHAIEFDFADKAMEAIGQAGFYAVKTGRHPGVVLIIEKDEDYRFLWRLLTSIRGDRKQWAVWVVTPETLNKTRRK